MAAPVSSTRTRWDEATREAASLLREQACVVIVGDKPEAAAEAALAMARANAGRRRVTIVDAVGELAPLQRALPRDAGPHGVIDHFLHGVSLRKIAHAVNREGTLSIIPSGTGPFEYETLLRRERWRRLTMAFRNEGALLLIVLPHDADGLTAFVEDTDGVVLVGAVHYGEERHVIARVATSVRSGGDVAVARAPRWNTRSVLQHRWPLVAAAAALLIAISLWVVVGDREDARDVADATDSVIAASAANGEMLDLRAIDSTVVSVYSIDVVMFNSLSEAGRHLTEHLTAIPASTFSPVVLGADSARWYRVVAGAWPTQAAADSALTALRDDGVLQLGFGSVRRTPFAVRVARDMPLAEAMSKVIELRNEGFPAYVLQRDAGHARVYAGAFETPSQATTLLDMFKRAGIDAVIDYRIGRGI
jgi:hypothetical protein